VREAILKSALPCDADTESAHRCLVGRLNVLGASYLIQGGKMSEQLEGVEAAGCGCEGITQTVLEETVQPQQQLQESLESAVLSSTSLPPTPESLLTSTQIRSSSSPSNSIMSNNRRTGIAPSQAPSELEDLQLVYALGTLGYDFGSEARRDSPTGKKNQKRSHRPI
jgi:hypothetical protein